MKGFEESRSHLNYEKNLKAELKNHQRDISNNIEITDPPSREKSLEQITRHNKLIASDFQKKYTVKKVIKPKNGLDQLDMAHKNHKNNQNGNDIIRKNIDKYRFSQGVSADISLPKLGFDKRQEPLYRITLENAGREIQIFVYTSEFLKGFNFQHGIEKEFEELKKNNNTNKVENSQNNEVLTYTKIEETESPINSTRMRGIQIDDTGKPIDLQSKLLISSDAYDAISKLTAQYLEEIKGGGTASEQVSRIRFRDNKCKIVNGVHVLK